MKNNCKMFIFSAMALFLCSFHSQNTVKPEMVMVEGGTFKMFPKDVKNKMGYDVTISSFEIGKFEVTVADWKRFIEETGQEMPAKPTWGWNDDYPITNVKWTQAIQYCNWLSKANNLKPVYTKDGDKYTCDFTANGYRLPTDAEWEFAARGGNKSKQYTYSGGNDLELISWYAKNSRKSPRQTGTKLANELGIHDMSGNVWEWCWDWYNPIFYKTEKRINPVGPEKGENRCIRGGSWDTSKLEYLTPSYRLNSNPMITNAFYGFRVAKTVTK